MKPQYPLGRPNGFTVEGMSLLPERSFGIYDFFFATVMN